MIRSFEDDEPIVPAKTWLRRSTFRQLAGHAANRNMTLSELLSKLADAALKPVEFPEPRVPGQAILPARVARPERPDGVRRYTRLTDDEKAQIIELRAAGVWVKVLADRFGCSQGTIVNVTKKAAS